MRVEGFVIRLRPRGNFEAADLGVRLYQSALRSVLPSYLAVWLASTALACASFEIAPWLPVLLLWCAKPWLDRTILFTLARAAFGQKTTLSDVWSEQRQVWWGQLWRTLTLRRFSPWRSFTQPVYQLEGLRGAQLRARVKQIKSGRTRAAYGVTQAFACAETSLVLAISSLAAWFAPQGYESDLLNGLFGGDSSSGQWWALGAYAVAIAFVEPFYVASGFALYLNRRAELEAWDIEQEFRRAF